MAESLVVAAVLGVVLAFLVQTFGIEYIGPVRASETPITPTPPQTREAPAPELVPLLRHARGQVMETMHYRVAPAERSAFLATMREVRQVRGRAGASFWQLYEDVAHPEGWLEQWSMESWTDHLREVGRLSEADRAVLGRACAFQSDPETRPPGRPGRRRATWRSIRCTPPPMRSGTASDARRSPLPVRPPRWEAHDGLKPRPRGCGRRSPALYGTATCVSTGGTRQCVCTRPRTT
jgi:hypothetical protein